MKKDSFLRSLRKLICIPPSPEQFHIDAASNDLRVQLLLESNRPFVQAFRNAVKTVASREFQFLVGLVSKQRGQAFPPERMAGIGVEQVCFVGT